LCVPDELDELPELEGVDTVGAPLDAVVVVAAVVLVEPVDVAAKAPPPPPNAATAAPSANTFLAFIEPPFVASIPSMEAGGSWKSLGRCCELGVTDSDQAEPRARKDNVRSETIVPAAKAAMIQPSDGAPC
jgi:hypothetical protein